MSTGEAEAAPSEGVCSGTGWCWKLPLPQGERLDAVIGRSDTVVWAVGRDTLLAFDHGRWRRIGSAPPEVHFNALALRADGGFWAAGANASDEGVLFAWDGAAWRDSGVRTGYVTAMFVAEDRDVWLISRNEERHKLQRWDGEALQEVALPTTAFVSAIDGTGGRDLWLAADDGVFHWNGDRWSRERAGGTGLLVRGANDVWVADAVGAHHLEPSGWRSWPLQSSGPDRQLYEGGNGTVWMIAGTAVFRFKDGGWHETNVHDDRVTELKSLWGAADGSAWIVGGRSGLMRWDGEGWSSTVPWFARLGAVWGVTDDDVWVGGDHGLLAHWDGGTWTQAASPVSSDVGALWGTATDDVWAAAGDLLHWNGDAWSRVDVHHWAGLDAVWGTGPTDVWAAGAHVLVHFDGCWWTTAPSPSRYGGGAGHVSRGVGGAWILEGNGLYRVEPQRWSRERTPKLHAIHGGHTAGLWAIGEERGESLLLRRSDAGSWGRMQMPAAFGGYLADARVHVWSADAIWLADGDGGIHRWDGHEWHDEGQNLTRGRRLTRTWISPSGGIWLVGGVLSGVLHKPGSVDLPDRPVASPAHPRECRPDVTVAAIEAALSSAGSRGTPVATTPATAREVARQWLEAMRDADVVKLARLSALPLTVRGLGPSLPVATLGGEPIPGAQGTDGAGLTTRHVARDIEGFRVLLDAVLGDPNAANVPFDDGRWWPHAAGRVRSIRPATLAKRLRRYRADAKALAAEGCLLVQAVMTDRGLTTQAVVAVRAGAGGPRVSAVLFDAFFEH